MAKRKKGKEVAATLAALRENKNSV